MEFKGFNKLARLNRDCTITEKIDGTNACVVVSPITGTVTAQSRTRIITPEDDNFGFAAWVRDHADDLQQLGHGYHFGEWWGPGIQRRYGIAERRFSLFRHPDVLPHCCHVVPKLYEGLFSGEAIQTTLAYLALGGSVASPGFMRPEGIVVWHHAARVSFKVTLEGDAEPKSKYAQEP